MPDPNTITEWRDSPTTPRPDRVRLAARDFMSRRLAIAVGFLIVIALVYWPSSVALDGEWRDTIDKTYTHGYLILLISLWLMWRDRGRLEAAPLQPEPLALPALVVLSAAWLFFWRAAVQDPHLLLLPLLLYTALLAVFGRAGARVLRFPVGFLYFAMPVWSDLVDPLQRLSAAANGALIWLTGLPAYMDGDLIRLPAGTLKIAEGCSGMHFFIVGCALAALYGEVMRDSLRLRLIWLALMAVLALVANWLRIFVIAVAAYETHMQTYLVTVDHYWFGWFVFAACFAFFLWICGRIAVALEPAGGSDGSDGTGGTGGTVGARSAPGGGSAVVAPPARPSVARCIAAVACLSVLPLVIYATDASRGQPAAGVAIDWPVATGWSGPQTVMPSRWIPVFQGATASAHRRYVDASGRSVEFFVVAYRRQRQGAKLVAYGNSLLGEGGLRVLGGRIVDTPEGPWRERTIVNADGDRSLLWSQIRIGSRRFAWPRLSQLWYGVVAFASEPLTALVAVRASCEAGCGAAAARLASAAGALQPALRRTRVR